MLWRVHPQTVNLIPPGKHSWFDSKLLHQFLRRGVTKVTCCDYSILKFNMVLKCSWTHDGLSRRKSGDRYPLGPPSYTPLAQR